MSLASPIEHRDQTVGGHHEVGGLEVAVDDAGAIRFGQGAGHLDGVALGIGHGVGAEDLGGDGAVDMGVRAR